MTVAAASNGSSPHVPVLLSAILERVAPMSGHWVDATFGAGGYTRAFLDAGADQVTALDRDPMVFEMARDWAGDYGARLELVETDFGALDAHVSDVDGIVFDLGVSSMQLDQSERGFSFMRDGPLDMRMGVEGPTAADLVNGADEGHLADILYTFGEERASRRIARAIVRGRPFVRTLELAEVIEGCLPRPKPGQSHPATRSFQALRIAVNNELGQLLAGMVAAERAVKPGGWLAIVSFHSIEDRIAKRFLQARSGGRGRANRYAPVMEAPEPAFVMQPKRAIDPTPDEIARNPRARSARLRLGVRTSAAAETVTMRDLGLPELLTMEIN